jgi:hypothetical protein
MLACKASKGFFDFKIRSRGAGSANTRIRTWIEQASFLFANGGDANVGEN